ncbi:MAG: helix-turn-helix domain-containing protein [Thermodesulfobacteriota bacterium]
MALFRKADQCDTVENFGSRIGLERKEHQRSLEGVSKRLGISEMTLQRIEAGITCPGIHTNDGFESGYLTDGSVPAEISRDPLQARGRSIL